MQQDALYRPIKAAKRKRFLFGDKSLYELVAENFEDDLRSIEREQGFRFPAAVREALLVLGSCYVDELYIQACNNIYRFDEINGKMAGKVAFAKDILGNFYAFDPDSGTPDQIYYYSHDPLGWAVVAPDFTSYLQAFVACGFNALALTDDLQLNEC